jgi:conjugative relaxase-like TrwC/TraI family protein
MIATVKVLTLRARSGSDLARAARAVSAYVEGGQPQEMSPLRRYYGEGLAPGRARGSAAELVGLAAGRPVSGVALERLLRGEHAVTERPLLAASGSAGRALSTGDRGPRVGAGNELLTLEEAARRIGVSAAYLRQLAVRTTDRSSADADGVGAGWPEGSASGEAVTSRGPHLAAVKEVGTGRWVVSAAEVDRFRAERVPPAVVLGYDVTASAPKAISLLRAFGDEEIRRDVAAAMDVGVEAMLGYLERHAAVGTINGRNRPGLGLAVASYLHEVSRSDEAHLHVHSIVVNAIAVPDIDEHGRPAVDGEGRPVVDWRALDGEVFLAHVKTAGYVGAAALRHELTRRRGLRWGLVRNGVAELAGFPQELLAAFSTRHGEVQAEYAQLVAEGMTPGGVTAAAAQRGSRAAKKVLADAQVRRIQLERLTAAGWTPEGIRRLATAAPDRPCSVSSDDVAALCETLTGPTGLTERNATFDRQAVVRQVASWAVDRLPAEQIEQLADQVLADRRVVLLGHDTSRARRAPAPVYTTQELLEAEDTVLALCRQGRVDAGAPPRILVDQTTLEAHLADACQPLPLDGSAAAGSPGEAARPEGAPAGPLLAAEQVTLVRRLLSSGDLVRPVVGPAGSGKTEAMRLLTRIVQASGGTVFATAHGGRQTEELTDRIAVPGRVVSGWLTLLDHTDDPSQVWPAGSVLIVDEATQVSTRDAARLLRYATQTGTVIVLLGDPAQLGSVGAGGWYAHLVAVSPDVPALGALHRQVGAALAPVRAALGALRADTGASARKALEMLAAAGRIRLFDSREALLDQVVDDWYAERAALHDTATAPRDTVGAGRPPTAPGRNAGVSEGQAGDRGRRRSGGPARPRPAPLHMMAERTRDVDLLARAARARLAADGSLTGPVLTVAGREFQAGDEVITLTQAGHTLIPDGKPASAYIRTGTVGRVVDVHLDPDHPDRQALTVHFPGKGRVRVPWTYLTHRFTDGRDGGLGYAYAITAAKAEGSSMPTARAVAPDDTSRAGLYVMLSRARTDLAAYVIRRPDLEADLDEEDWLPVLRDPTGPLERLGEHLAQSRTERLAREFDRLAHAAHRLRRSCTLADLARLPAPTSPGATRPRSPSDGAPAGGHHSGAARTNDMPAPTAPNPRRTAPERADTALGTDPVAPPVARRAELAAEAAIAAAAVTNPPAALVARLGPRPDDGGERILWDRAVGGLAVYHARHQAGPADDPGPAPSGPEPAGTLRTQWMLHHDQAVRIARAWSDGLPRHRSRARMHGQAERVPRARVIAGIHALLDHGHHPDTLLAALTSQEQTTVRTGAAGLDHRVTDLCEQEGLSPTDYLLPPPRPAHEDWQELVDLLRTCEIHHLARRPTAQLANERHRLLRTEAAASATPVSLGDDAPADNAEPAVAAQDALTLIEAALDQQIARAIFQAAIEPTEYLTGLLGDRPAVESDAAGWDDRAEIIERFRHRELGLPYGALASSSAETNPLRRAVGPRPVRSAATANYDQVLALDQEHAPTFDL